MSQQALRAFCPGTACSAFFVADWAASRSLLVTCHDVLKFREKVGLFAQIFTAFARTFAGVCTTRAAQQRPIADQANALCRRELLLGFPEQAFLTALGGRARGWRCQRCKFSSDVPRRQPKTRNFRRSENLRESYA